MPPFALPRWTYRPGRDAEPDRATLDIATASVPPRFERIVPADHPALAYGIALNDSGFFWECHEVLEAVWKAAPKGGRDRILLRACIQIANANLKDAMGQPRAAERLRADARDELEELSRRGRVQEGFAGAVDVVGLTTTLTDVAPRNSGSHGDQFFPFMHKNA